MAGSSRDSSDNCDENADKIMTMVQVMVMWYFKFVQALFNIITGMQGFKARVAQGCCKLEVEDTGHNKHEAFFYFSDAHALPAAEGLWDNWKRGMKSAKNVTPHDVIGGLQDEDALSAWPNSNKTLAHKRTTVSQ